MSTKLWIKLIFLFLTRNLFSAGKNISFPILVHIRRWQIKDPQKAIEQCIGKQLWHCYLRRNGKMPNVTIFIGNLKLNQMWDCNLKIHSKRQTTPLSRIPRNIFEIYGQQNLACGQGSNICCCFFFEENGHWLVNPGVQGSSIFRRRTLGGRVGGVGAGLHYWYPWIRDMVTIEEKHNVFMCTRRRFIHM